MQYLVFEIINLWITIFYFRIKNAAAISGRLRVRNGAGSSFERNTSERVTAKDARSGDHQADDDEILRRQK